MVRIQPGALKQLAPSTLRRYRSIVEVHLLFEFGASTPLRRLTAERIELFRERLLAEDRQSRDSMRQIFGALNGPLERALRRKWIGHNPMSVVEPIPMPKPSGDFNVLTPVQVEVVARAAEHAWARVDPTPWRASAAPARPASD